MKLTALVCALLLAGVATSQNSTPLKTGKEVDGSLEDEQPDIYSLNLDSGQFVYGFVHQKTVDVVVEVKDPEGKPVGSFDVPARGREPFQFNTIKNGDYRLAVKPFKQERGDYSILVKRVEEIAEKPSKRVDQILVEYQGTDVPGAAVRVLKNGKVIFDKNYGMADLTNSIPFSERTVHNIGSTSKQFTAFAIAMLADQGKLSLDDDIRKHIPELKDFGKTVTIRNLLTHTSGYREFINLVAMTGMDPSTPMGREKLLEIVNRQPELQNDPGAEWNYNNTGFGLLTLVVERTTDTPFAQWLDENIFTPLGMDNTQVRANINQVIENRSMGYKPGENGGYAEGTDVGGARGAGGVHSTMDDLTKWLNNYRSHKLGSEAVHEMMTTKFVKTDGDTTSYGLGLFIDNYKGLKRIHHGGADLAHRSNFIMFPEIDAAVITQSNYAGFTPDIADAIVDAFFEEEMDTEEPKPQQESQSVEEKTETIEYDEGNFDPLTGRYEMKSMPGFILSFHRDGDRLYTQATGQPELDIKATSDSTFTLVGVEADLTFHMNEDGSADSLTLHQNGHHVATKIKWEPSTEELKEFEGRYFSEEIQTVYRVALKDSSLVLKNYHLKDDIPMSPGKEDIFGAGFPIAEVSFTRSEDGTITGFEASNGRTRGVAFRKMKL